MFDDPERFKSAELACAEEPVHIPGAIQAYGALIALNAEMTRVVEVSANVGSLLGLDAKPLLGGATQGVLGGLLERIRTGLAERERLAGALEEVFEVAGELRQFQVFAYRSSGRVVVEFEPEVLMSARGHLEGVRHDIDRIVSLSDPLAVLNSLARTVQRLTGYHRVMVYTFDEDWNGRVIAESVVTGAASYLDHCFPASDIPPQVREIYSVNRVRSIPDAQAAPVPLLTMDDDFDGEPLDLSPGMLRAASPVHCTYLANMGVGASMSVALHRDGRLWGLVACHHDEAMNLSPAVRNAAATLALAGSQRIFLLDMQASMRFSARVQQERLLLRSALDLAGGPGPWIQEHGQRWLELFSVTGLVMIFDDTLAGVGRLPDECELRRISSWLDRNVSAGACWHTRSLAQETGACLARANESAGLLAITLQEDRLRRGWLLMFRPEIVETIRWAGRPDQKRIEERAGRLVLSPRTSFESWVEAVQGYCEPWSVEVVTAAKELGIDLALIRAGHRIEQLGRTIEKERSELASLARELQRSNQELEVFARVASHDLQEPLRKIAAFAGRLEGLYAHTLDERGLDYLTRMTGAAERMQQLIDDLLNMSRVNTHGMAMRSVDLGEIVSQVLVDLEERLSETGGTVTVAELPEIEADPTQMRQLLQNLIANALKYVAPGQRPEVEVIADEAGQGWVRLSVLDRGIGLPGDALERIFSPFVRLHGRTKYAGTGLGLAVVKRIVDRHGGRVSASLRDGGGACFCVELPCRQPKL